MNIILMGPQGSGKSTQARLLCDKLKIPHIETGEIYRRLSLENSPLGKKVKDTLDRGGLIDDQTTLEVIDQHLGKIKTGFILDGFPRTLIQAQRELFPVDRVIFINLSDQEAINRLLLRRRRDDTRELISERLRLYHQQTEPVLEYYRKNGKLIEIDGNGSIEEVNALISKMAYG